MSVKIAVDTDFVKGFHKDIQKGIMKGLESAGLAFEREAKLITTREEHVVTGRYRSSINYNEQDGIGRQQVGDSEPGDGIHEFEGYEKLSIGSAVEYSVFLEKKYGIMGRALDASSSKMKQLFISGLKKNIKWLQ